MTFLIDVNLPPRLCPWLAQRNHQATHLCDVDALRAPDRAVWALASDRSAVIISKDTDFHDLSLLRGQPPQVLLISLGNCSNEDLLLHLSGAWADIEDALNRGARLVVLHSGRLEIFET